MDLCEINFKLNESVIFRRFEKIDWKQIASVNMDQLKLSSDCEIIEKNIKNILCCHIESEFDQKNMDVNLVVKLFKLAQISIEYLLHIRQQIMTDLKSDRDKLNANISLLDSISKEKEELTKKFKELKKETKKTAAGLHYFRCPICPKTFVTGDFLKSHLQRRHQEMFYAKNPVQPPQTPVENATIVPVASPAPSSVVDVSKDDINEFKMRLHVAEKKLEEDKVLLNAILEKVEKSNDSLQDILLKEVQKIRSSLAETRTRQDTQPVPKVVEKEIILLPREPAHHHDVQIQNSPVKLISAAAQTTPRLNHNKASNEVAQDSTDSSSTSSERKTPPAVTECETQVDGRDASILSGLIPIKDQPYKPISEVKVVQVRKELPESSSSEDSSIISSSSFDEDAENQETTKQLIRIGSTANAKNIDQNVFNRFKQTIENAFEQRLKQMGIESKKGLSSSKCRRVIQLLENQRRQRSGSMEEFNRIRLQFENQLRNRLTKKKQLHDSKNVGDLPTKKLLVPGFKKIQSVKTFGQKNLESSLEKKKSTKDVPNETPPFNRAPVPTPRARNQPSTSLMSRDGEATDSSFQTPKSIKDIADSLEREVKSRSIRPPVNAVDTLSVRNKESEPPADNKPDPEKDDDSFSLSSLDEILAQLKQPKIQTSTPKTQRSVQWKEPVESSQLEADNSWDSGED